MAFTVTKDTIIGDIMDADENTAPYFMEMGMHCLFCPASRGETLEEACAVHGVRRPAAFSGGERRFFSLEESFG